jgi:cysteinylglycine-S-conjugate dipeptidase
VLATLHDEHGNTTVDGLDPTGTWTGVDYGAEQFREDANVLDGVKLMGDGTPADLLWARPSAAVIGRCRRPHVIGLANAVQASATARVSLRLPPGTTGQQAQDALVAHLQSRVPSDLPREIERIAMGDPFVGSLDGSAYPTVVAEGAHEDVRGLWHTKPRRIELLG